MVKVYSGVYRSQVVSKLSFGQRLRQVRDFRGLSQSEVAVRAKIPVAMISHFETGVRGSASADNLVKLANALEVSVDYLLGRTEDPAPRSGPVEAALLRSLGNASREQIDSVVRIAEAITERDRRKER
jgi:transcriptional regulator with XRE-family HTH domain